ncbi:Bug family tripartite tricarboxylate transporter substrate binding protein [Pararhodobacter sp.]|jgi:tripartite-type tricarboxylate transporter receptor subunit TctC|uniref:Bug family tripartite tricarboxylate transporter substrate binding protein n=1 Tax=Pararhodobacter sp. TaxID=2127056 RepID=UPI002FDCB091
MTYRKPFLGVLAGIAMLAGSPIVAQNFPNDTITVVVAYPPGGFNDTVARMIAESLSQTLGVSTVVDNRPGGGTVVGTDVVARAAPDGYTIGISPFAFAVNPGLFDDLPYDTDTDFDHVIILGDSFNVLAARNDFPADNTAELVAYARENPGDINYASAGNGSSNHLSAELFNYLAGTDMVHIPYGGSAPARTDLIAGRVDVMFDNYTNLAELVANGDIKALGITLQEESDLMPGIAPVSDALEGYEVTTWWGVLAPAGLSEEAMGTLNQALNAFLQAESTIQAFAREGATIIGGSPEDAEAYVRRQVEQWRPIAEEVEMSVD